MSAGRPTVITEEALRKLEEVFLNGAPDINTSDYNDTNPAVLIARMEKDLRIREHHHQFQQVLGFHELPITIEALKVLIPFYQAHGYEFVRLDEIFH